MDVVTGATGHLGNVLVRSLLARGRTVRALARNGSDVSCLAGTEVEIARGDILEPEGLARALAGSETVFHTAGYVSFGLGEEDLIQEVNVRGTENVIRAAISAGVRRLVYVSSIEALDLTGTGVVTEEAGFHPRRTVLRYGAAKAAASLAVQEAAAQGLNAVIVCPTGYFGPHDYRLSAMGRLVLDFVRGRLPVIVDGGFDFVDVRDVADGAVGAAERGRAGESYILSGEYSSVRRIMDALQARTGMRAPSLVLPGGLALAFARAAELWYAARRAPPRFTVGSIRLLSLGVRVSCQKARNELGYEPRPFLETLDATLAWFADAGLMEPEGQISEAES